MFFFDARGLARVCVAASAFSVLTLAGSRVLAAEHALPAHQIMSEEASDTRRAVSVRLEQRLEEADAIRLATAINRRQKSVPVRSYVNFFLPGVQLSQGAWASVMFNPEPKFLAHGLKREDEQALIAEHRADTRPLLGSWLTSPPAAVGRLTIYSDAGRIYAEWRLKNGQKSLEELKDASTATSRRFELPGGNSYVLTRSGDLEIWSGVTLVAVGERIRVEPAPSTTRVAAARLPGTPGAPSLLDPRGQLSQERLSQGTLKATPINPPAASTDTQSGSPARLQSAARSADTIASTANSAPGGSTVANPPPAGEAPVTAPVASATAQPAGQPKSRRQAITAATAEAAARPRRSRALTTGDQISAKIAGAL